MRKEGVFRCNENRLNTIRDKRRGEKNNSLAITLTRWYNGGSTLENCFWGSWAIEVDEERLVNNITFVKRQLLGFIVIYTVLVSHARRLWEGINFKSWIDRHLWIKNDKRLLENIFRGKYFKKSWNDIERKSRKKKSRIGMKIFDS